MMMISACTILCWIILTSSFTVHVVLSKTDYRQVAALNDMYQYLKPQSKLGGWKLNGGNPCDDSWHGIKCSGSDVTEVHLSGLGLTGSLGFHLDKLEKVTYLDFSQNQFGGSVPYSISQMADLKSLSLNNNKLSGSLSDMFGKLTKLTEMHIQNNQFSGSINVLADLSNVANNQFNGWIPDELKGIKNLQTGGNSWSSGASPPPPPDRKLNHTPGTAIAGILLGVLLLLGVIIALLSRRKRSPPSSHFLEEDKFSWRQDFTPHSSQESSSGVRANMQEDFRASYFRASKVFQYEGDEKSAPLDHLKSFNDKEFIAHYPLADLQNATSNFASSRLLGEGSIGRVYKAKYPDGRDGKCTEFTDIVSKISKLHHPNIGQQMLIFEYFRNGSLYEFLHVSDDFSKPLTWNTRVRIALGAARALEYLYEVCSPSCLHRNIKTSNIVLDAELDPRLCECGLATFHVLARKNLDAGYTAPECTKPSAYTLKSDVYSFGVVMLELLTGRKPFDSSKPRLEQYLVQWALPQLNDLDALEKIADPALHGLYPPKSLSRFANVTALCIQSEPEFRPNISEVVHLVQKSNMIQREDDLSASRRTDYDDDY
ncbi:unnamed protein product [Withania somnifera]